MGFITDTINEISSSVQALEKSCIGTKEKVVFEICMDDIAIRMRNLENLDFK